MGGYLATLRVRLTAEIGELQRRMQEAEGILRSFAKVASVLSVVTVGLAALGFAWDATTDKALEFNTAMSEVATVADPASIDALTASVQKLSLQFGGTAAAQAQGLYEIISAGTSDAAAATEALAQSNKLAIGGVTSVKIAADGLTSAMNAYGAASGGAQAVSDSFFVAAAQGKTTISELSNNIGRVAPLAASLKIPLDEVTGALAALTKGGIATGPATAGLAQILSSVVKPSEQAAETAAKLGLEFNAAALQSKGLAGFLADVADKTKGNTTAMGLLFGGVEALVPALALSTTGAADFANALEAMENKAGATDRAYAIMAESMANRTARLQAQISGAAVTIGTALLNVAIPAAEAFANNFVPIMEVAAQVVTVLAAVIAVKLAAALIGFVKQQVAAIAARRAATLSAVQSTAAELANSRALLDHTTHLYAEANAELASARANTLATGSVVEQQAALARLSVVQGIHRKATDGATAAQIAHEAAIRATSLRATAGARAIGILKGAMAFFGGPWGLAITAVLAAVGFAFLKTGRDARKAAEDAKIAADKFMEALNRMSDADLKAAFARNVADVATVIGSEIPRAQRHLAELRRLAEAGRAVWTTPTATTGGASVPMLTEFGRQLRRAEANVAEWVALRDRMSDEQRKMSDILAQRTPAFGPEMPEIPELNIDLGDTEKGKREMDAFIERAGALVSILQDQRTAGLQTASVMSTLAWIGAEAQSRLAGLGEPASLSGDALQDYRNLLGVVLQIRDAMQTKVKPFWEQQGADKFLADLERVAGAVKQAQGAGSSQVKADNLAETLRLLAVTDRGAAMLVAAYGDYVGKIFRGAAGATDKLKTVAGDVREALKDGAQVAHERLTAAAKVIREAGSVGGIVSSALSRSIDGPLREFASTFAQIRDARKVQADARQPVSGLPPVAAAAGMMVAMEFFAGLMQQLGPALQALLLPVSLLGQAFGTALLPIIRALFPVFKAVTIAATYVGQVFFTVAGAISKAVGWLVRGLGKLLNELPGSIGNPLVRAGEAMIATGQGFLDGAKELAAAREEIRGLSFDDALSRVTDGANKAADSMYNLPTAFRKLSQLTWMTQNARNPVRVTQGGATAAGAGVAGASMSGPTLNVQPGAIVINAPAGADVQAIAAAALSGLKQIAKAQFGDSIRWAEVQ